MKILKSLLIVCFLLFGCTNTPQANKDIQEECIKGDIIVRSSKIATEDELDTDQNKYEVTSVVTFHDIDITLRENTTEQENVFIVYVAKWTINDTHYCILCENGLFEYEIMQMITEYCGI